MKHKKIKKSVKAWIIGIAAAATVGIPIGVKAAQSYIYSTRDPKYTDQAVSKTWVQTSDDTWVMDTDGDGKNDVALKSSINDAGEQEFNYTFDVIDDTQAYYVYEEMTQNGSLPLKNGYTASGSDSKQAIPQEPGQTVDKTYTITNHTSHTPPQAPGTGGLKITKHVTGDMPDTEQKFSFTVTLSAGNNSTLQSKISGDKVFGSTAFSDGVAKVSLSDGESVEITGIPAGVAYTITEDPLTYYDTTKTNDTGTITKDEVIESVWTNNSKYTKPGERPTTSLTIQKTVTGAAKPETSKYYSYTVLLENLKINERYSYTVGDTTEGFRSDGSGTADLTFKLKDGEKAVFSGLQTESTYMISEDGGEYDENGTRMDGTFVPSYTVTDANNLGSIVSENGTGTVNTNLVTAKETADNGENVTVTFTNDYPAVQSLTLKKYVSKKINGNLVTTDKNSDAYKALSDDDKASMDAEAEKEFEFTVTFSNLPETAEITSSVGKFTADEDGQCSKTFKLKADGSEIRFTDIPTGTQYQIQETKDSKYNPSYEITTVNTNGDKIEGTVNKTSDTNSSTQIESVEDNQSDVVTFTNEYHYIPMIIPTGIIIRVAPYILMAAAAVVVIIFIKKSSNHKKS